jgi:hypothetical protein
VAKIGTVLSAIMASSCCWLPPILLAVGVSGAGIASALAAYRPLFMVVTFGFLGTAFYFTYRPRHGSAGAADCCAVPSAEADAAGTRLPRRFRFNMMTMNKVMLWAVTALAVVFLFFPQIFTGLLAGSDEITPDMTRVEVQIDGMTCFG